VFLVHGHDEEAKQTVARFIEKLGLEPIVLHEQPNKGLTIIEKFEDYSDVGFAVVLLTPDDIGASKSSPKNTRSRARQNVILELGFFIGRLKRHQVCALHKGDLELPSDYLGVLWIPMDADWRNGLAREMNAAGLEVDLTALIS
jgi:predicted nucleotide-binding protein